MSNSQEPPKKNANQNGHIIRKNKAQIFFETASSMFIIIKNDQTIEQVNPKTCEVLGYSKDELIGKNWFDTAIPENIREKTRSTFKQIMSGEVKTNEYHVNPIINKDGQERDIAWHNAVLRNESGQIISTFSSGNDITERNKMIEELKKSAKDLKEINKLMVGRELKMIELKKEIEELKRKLSN